MSETQSGSAAALEREFASAVTRVGAVFATALIVGTILALIIGQQMREHEARLKVIGSEARKLRRQEALLTADLKRAKKRSVNAFERAKTYNPSLKKIDASLTVRVAIDKTLRAQRLADIDKLLSRIDRAIDTLAAAPKVKKDPKEKGLPGSYAQESLEIYRAALTEYRNKYDAAAALEDLVAAQRAEARTLRQSKQSLPTPFGQFNVSPRVGLIGVLLGLIVAQIYFVLMADRTRRIAVMYETVSPGTPITRGVAAPAWLETWSGADLAAVLAWRGGHRSRRARSLALHAVWIALSGWLVVEIIRWRAWEDVLVAPRTLLFAVLVLAALASIAAAVVFLTDSMTKVVHRLPFDPSRRGFLQLSGVATGALLAFVFLRLSPRKPKPSREGAITVADLGESTGNLVVNRSTRVVHHARVCAGHLPKLGERGELASADVLHTNCRVAILTALAEDEGVRESERLIQMAMAISPLSIHLYDALIREDAQHKEIRDDTRAIVQRGMQRVQAELAAAREVVTKARTNRERKRAEKAVARLEQIETQFRERVSKLSRKTWTRKSLKRFFRRRTL